MSDACVSPQTIKFTDPFHGPIWMHVAPASGTPGVRLIVSLEASWDVDVLIGNQGAAKLASALGHRELVIINGETADHEPAVLVAEGDRLIISVPRARLSDVLSLGPSAEVLRERLRVASAANE
jgi:hypothetical protein